MVQLVTRQQLADLWGLAPSSVDNLVQSGKLKKFARGMFDLDEAQRVRAGMRPTPNRTDRIMRLAAEAEAKPTKRATKPDKAAVAAPSPAPPSANLQTESDPGPDISMASAKMTGKVAEHATLLAKARTTKEVFTARAAELNYKREAGLVVETEKVKNSAANAARLVVARLRALAPRVGPQVAPLTTPAECVAVIDKEVRALIAEFQEMMAAI